MAFKIRAEFWIVTDPSAGIGVMGAPLLDRTIADAIEIDENTV